MLSAADLARLRAVRTSYFPHVATLLRTGATVPCRIGAVGGAPNPQGLPSWQAQASRAISYPATEPIVKGDSLSVASWGTFYLYRVNGMGTEQLETSAEGLMTRDATGTAIPPFIASDVAAFQLPDRSDTITNAPVYIERVSPNPWTDQLALGYQYRAVYDVNLRYPNHPNVWPDENHLITTATYILGAGHTATLSRAIVNPGPIAVRTAYFLTVEG